MPPPSTATRSLASLEPVKPLSPECSRQSAENRSQKLEVRSQNPSARISRLGSISDERHALICNSSLVVSVKVLRSPDSRLLTSDFWFLTSDFRIAALTTEASARINSGWSFNDSDRHTVMPLALPY